MRGDQIKIGLALGGGGPRGLAHVGVIKAILEAGIKIDVIAGTSAGALIGGLYLALGSIDKLQDYLQSLTYKDLAWMLWDPGTKSGIIRGEKFEKYLEKISNGKKIEDLQLPFAAVATDLLTGDVVVKKEGSLSRAIRASSAIPMLLGAVKSEGRDLVDGGVSCPVPVSIARDMGANYVIAVNLDGKTFLGSTRQKTLLNIPDVGMAAIKLLRYNLAKEICKMADWTIEPEVADLSPINLLQLIRGKKVVEEGYEAAWKILPKIKRDLESVRSLVIEGDDSCDRLRDSGELWRV